MTPTPDSGPSPWANPDSPWQGAGAEPTAELPSATGPTMAFGSPQDYLAASGHAPVAYEPVGPGAWTGAEVPVAPPTRGRRLVPVLLLALALIVAGGGVAAAGYWFGWLGAGGKRPAELFPAATAAYLQLDLNPSPAQKLAAWEFLRELPEVEKARAAGQTDPKRLLWDLLSAAGIAPKGRDYDRDLAPWLGDRLGVGVVTKDDRPIWMAAVQVIDEAKAAAQLRDWLAGTDPAAEVTTRDGYAVITPGQDTAYLLGELARGSLADDAEFAADMAGLGDTGVAAGWVDAARVSESLATEPRPGDRNPVRGRAAFALRFSAGVLSLEGRFSGLEGTGANGSGELANLPATTGAAVSISGGAKMLEESWPLIGTDASAWLDPSGLTREDLAALLGRNLTLSIPTSALSGISSGEQPVLGLRVVGDDIARAQQAVHRLTGLTGEPSTVVDTVDGDVLTAATTQEYLAELTGAGPKLATSEVFTRAVPDPVKAMTAGYVDIVPLVSADVKGGPYGAFLQSLRAVGWQYVDDGSGAGSWSIRLVRG